MSWGAQKILAIKHVRGLSGLGLKQAKEAVEEGRWFALSSPPSETLLDELRRGGIELELDGEREDPSEPPGDAPDSAAHAKVRLRYHSGPKKIHAIKLVREIERGLGLREAKTLVESQGTLSLMYREVAEIWAKRFAEIGSKVEILPASSSSELGVTDAPGSPAHGEATPSARSRSAQDEDEDDYDF